VQKHAVYVILSALQLPRWDEDNVESEKLRQADTSSSAVHEIAISARRRDSVREAAACDNAVHAKLDQIQKMRMFSLNSQSHIALGLLHAASILFVALTTFRRP